MTGRARRIASLATLSSCVLLAACHGKGATLTLEGNYSGTTESSCQVSVREVGTWRLMDSYQLEPSFRQDFEMGEEKGSYIAEVHCADGKSGSSPPFEFEPPRARTTLRDIELF